MLRRIEQLTKQIEGFKEQRKLLIKMYEQTLLSRVESDIINELRENCFDIVEHQSGLLIHAKRGINDFRVRFPMRQSFVLGHLKLNVTYNDIQIAVAALINHQFASVEYNYLTLDMNEIFRRRVQELTFELNTLKELSSKDIDGSYSICAYDESRQDSGELRSLRDCFKEMVHKHQV